jgi:2-polyprenyl-3-methyl-5-hydroxy-6-metoxy-1,4-benzoquinol methylase
MDTKTLGEHYSQIAEWWDGNHRDSKYGVEYVERAIRRVKNRGKALDVGCGSGGQIVETILGAGFSLTALDASQGMIDIAQKKHPSVRFVNIDFMSWTSEMMFDLVVAWDSTFHAPSTQQKPIVEKMCSHLSPDGVLLFTGSDDNSDIVGEDMNGVGFEYGSLHYLEYLQIIEDCGCDFMIVERDQPCLGHVVYICKKRNG